MVDLEKKVKKQHVLKGPTSNFTFFPRGVEIVGNIVSFGNDGWPSLPLSSFSLN